MPERVKKLRDFFGIPRRDDFRSFGGFVSSPAMTWLFIIIFAAFIAILSTFYLQRVPKGLEEGMIATRDIKADRNYEIVDEDATGKLRQDALVSVLPVYNFDEGLANVVSARIRGTFRDVRSKEQADPKELLEMFQDGLGIEVPAERFKALMAEDFSGRTEQLLVGIVASRLSQPIIAEKGMLGGEKESGIILRNIRSEDQETVISGETAIPDPAQIQSVADVRERIGKLELPRDKLRSKDSAAAIKAIAQEMIAPTVSFDTIETDKRRAAATANVQDVTIRIKAGEMIVRNGERVDQRHIKILNGIMKETGRGTYPVEFLGTVLFILLLLLSIYYFAERYVRRFHPTRRDYILMAVIAAVYILMIRIGMALVPVLHEALLYEIPTSALYYAIPLAGAPMLLRMFLHPEDSFIFAALMSFLIALFPEADLSYVAFSFLTGVVGVTAISNADKRSTILKAGAVTGLVSAFFILAMKLIGMEMQTGTISVGGVLWHMFCAFAGGFSSALLLLIVAPIIESLSDYTTDIKLLELANLNHPLLRELIVRAPGTYHHSHLVGILAEAAAEAIGANPLLVRVGAYYHDIGKIKKPQYFVENSKEGEDRHAKLLPHMSSLIISSHVKEGMDMAEEVHLPRAIIDMIPQHHGTREISFFLEKAQALATEDNPINEEDFHYPGPKPQSREAAILMLADVSEAAVRSLKEKSPSRIQQTVQRVINDCFADEQLNECELTLKDLNDIAKAFTHILLGIYHQRIEYPKEILPEPEVSVIDEETLVESEPPKPASKTAGGHRSRQKGA